MRKNENKENGLAKMIDHTFLKPDGSPSDIARLCREAKKHGFASVCVHPCEVKRCAKLLKGSGVKVCTVIGFPLGQNTPATIVFEASGALHDGADELDFVVNAGAVKVAAKKGKGSREAKSLASMWTAILAILRRDGAPFVSKLIIECCLLTDAEKRFACAMARAAGFDFVKTSTGFGSGGATVADVRLMRKAAGPSMGVKAAGGIRTREFAEALVEAGATRLGCSASVAIAE